MKTNLTVKNFRVFDENGVTFELNPITILTGCNSSGKSSIVKAVLLLDEYLKQIKKAIDNGDKIELNKYKIDFTKYPANTLGRFDRVVHEGSTSKMVTIEYSTHSLMLSKEVDVRLVFTSDENDDLNNGYLAGITLSTDDGVFYSSDKQEGSWYDLNIIKNSWIDFLQAEYVIHNFCGLESQHEFYGGVSESEYNSQCDMMITYLKGLERNRVKDILSYVRFANVQDSIINRCKADPQIIEWTKEHDSLFMIPVVEQLEKLSKADIKAYAEKELLTDASKGLVFATNKILDDFIGSDCMTFGEYFKNWEIKFLHREYDKFPRTEKSPCIFEIGRMKQDYLTFSPMDCKILLSIGESGLLDSTDEGRDSKRLEEWKNTAITFDMIYEVLMELNAKMNPNEKTNIFYYQYERIPGLMNYSHKMLDVVSAFASDLLKEIVCPDWCGNIEYVSSSRVKARRLYPLEANDDFEDLLKKYFEERRNHINRETKYNLNDKKYEVSDFVNSWIRKYEIGNSLSIHTDEEGLGAQVRLHKSSEDKKGCLLADEGYGITQLASILIQIETAILSAKGIKTNNYIGLSELDGFDNEVFHYENKTIAIEEPEIHLHPKFQSLLADMFVEAYKKYNINFIIETHSEYLIRKLQVLVANIDNDSEYHINNNNASILYVNSPKSEPHPGEPQVKQIGFCEDGYLDNTFGPGFFDEATNLSQKLL